MPPRPPARLLIAVACVAAAMLLVELLLTRMFSVLFYYHFSFLSISLVMSGLALGGLLASRWKVRDLDEDVFRERLVALCAVFSAGTLAGALYLANASSVAAYWWPPGTEGSQLEVSPWVAGGVACLFLPGLIAAGAFLAAALARRRDWIGRLYAADLAAAAAGCLGAILLTRTVDGVATLALPSALAALAALALGPRKRGLLWTAGVLTVASLAGTILGATGHAHWVGLRAELPANVRLTRWNEHSRIVTVDRKGMPFLVIDKTAGTYVPPTRPRAPGEPLPVDDWWDAPSQHIGMRLGRPLKRTAVIGVGGGMDLLAPLANGAEHVDGYELNGLIVELLQGDLAGHNGSSTWPEVQLMHNEARVGITHSGRSYDVIQASMIDTWASTASGGLVLSENGLYTVEAWTSFFSALSERGVLTMTRWYVPDEPAEMRRLVSLAAASLQAVGIQRPRDHVIAVAERADAVCFGTILVSRTPFTPEEVQRIQDVITASKFLLLVAPGVPAEDPSYADLLDPAKREAVIAASPFDLSAPTDARPFFFLQVRPSRLQTVLADTEVSDIMAVTRGSVRVLLVLAAAAFLLALCVFGLSLATWPSPTATPLQRATFRWTSGYFLLIGLGYILVQLALHQRLIIVLGHPTYALSVVLFSMLLGTGLGSFASERLAPDRFHRAWAGILVVLLGTALVLSGAGALEAIASQALRALLCAVLLAGIGFALGFAFPLGVRLTEPTGEWAVQRGWAVNAAATIAGSSLAALLGMALGSYATFLVGLACYVGVWACGARALRLAAEAPPSPESPT